MIEIYKSSTNCLLYPYILVIRRIVLLFYIKYLTILCKNFICVSIHICVYVCTNINNLYTYVTVKTYVYPYMYKYVDVSV